MRDELELLRRMRNGDQAAFGELYARHSPAVYRYALRMSGSDAAAEEVVQEVFLQVVKGCRGFDASIGRLASYLYGVARHTLARLSPDRGEIPIGELDTIVEAAGRGPAPQAGGGPPHALALCGARAVARGLVRLESGALVYDRGRATARMGERTPDSFTQKVDHRGGVGGGCDWSGVNAVTPGGDHAVDR